MLLESSFFGQVVEKLEAQLLTLTQEIAEEDKTAEARPAAGMSSGSVGPGWQQPRLGIFNVSALFLYCHLPVACVFLCRRGRGNFTFLEKWGGAFVCCVCFFLQGVSERYPYVECRCSCDGAPQHDGFGEACRRAHCS